MTLKEFHYYHQCHQQKLLAYAMAYEHKVPITLQINIIFLHRTRKTKTLIIQTCNIMPGTNFTTLYILKQISQCSQYICSI